jgi:hypothetical protein
MIYLFKFYYNFIRNSISLYQKIIFIGIFINKLYYQVSSVSKAISKSYISLYFYDLFFFIIIFLVYTDKYNDEKFY